MVPRWPTRQTIAAIYLFFPVPARLPRQGPRILHDAAQTRRLRVKSYWRLRHPSAIRATRQGRSITTIYLFKTDGTLLYAEGNVNLLEQYPKPTSPASHSPHGGGLFKHNYHLDSGKRAFCVGSGTAICFACYGMDLELWNTPYEETLEAITTPHDLLARPTLPKPTGTLLPCPKELLLHC